jgi:hypothetical protein
LSIKVKGAEKSLFYKLLEQGVVADWREPVPLRHFIIHLKKSLGL